MSFHVYTVLDFGGVCCIKCSKNSNVVRINYVALVISYSLNTFYVSCFLFFIFYFLGLINDRIH